MGEVNKEKWVTGRGNEGKQANWRRKQGKWVIGRPLQIKLEKISYKEKRRQKRRLKRGRNQIFLCDEKKLKRKGEGKERL